MNSSVYLFGNLASGYTQYPDDSSKEFFKSFYYNAKAPTQLCITRRGSLMYYGYIRKLNGDRFVGLCVLLNDMMHNRMDKLFALFENAFSQMVTQGMLIHFDEKGEIISSISRLHEHPDEVNSIMASLKGGFDKMEQDCTKLPPVDFSVGNQSIKSYSIADDNPQDILRSSYTSGYTFVYKSSNYQSAELDGFSAKLAQSYEQNSLLKDEIDQLKSQVGKLKREKQNTTWVLVLAMATAILGLILWFKVINPSEVTNKTMSEFSYYGPMANGEPNGVGVAVYHPNDKDGRRFYIGRFVNGQRQDTAAMLLYKGGNYFYGEMSGDHWVKGIQYYSSDNSHFEGSFNVRNEPYTGTWYRHEYLCKMLDGKIIEK